MATSGTNTINYQFFLPEDNSEGWGSAMRTFITIVDRDLNVAIDGLNAANGRLGTLERELTQKANVQHIHTIADVTGLQAALDSKSSTSHKHEVADVNGLQGALSGKAPTAHSHAISDVTNLQQTLDGKAPTKHAHAIDDITGLQAALEEKGATNHTHEISAILGLRAELDRMWAEMANLRSGIGSNGTGSGGTATFPIQMQVQPTDRFADAPYKAGATVTGNGIVSYEWKIGANVVSTDANPTLDFGGAGTYVVTVKCTNGSGETATASTTVIVRPAATTQTAEFSLSSVTRLFDYAQYTQGEEAVTGASYSQAQSQGVNLSDATPGTLGRHMSIYANGTTEEGRRFNMDATGVDTGVFNYAIPAEARAVSARLQADVNISVSKHVYVAVASAEGMPRLALLTAQGAQLARAFVPNIPQSSAVPATGARGLLVTPEVALNSDATTGTLKAALLGGMMISPSAPLTVEQKFIEDATNVKLIVTFRN